jgi:myo-inositol-1(or 4)-monophosphatase
MNVRILFMTVASFLHDTLIDAAKIANESSVTIRGRKDGAGNVVTEKDEAIHHYIVNAIARSYPSHAVLSEESKEEMPMEEVVRALDLWILDPLDGSTNDANGFPMSGISLAYLKDGELQLGGIYDLSRKELLIAEREKGAYKIEAATGSRTPLRVSDAGLNGGLIATSSPYREEEYLANQALARKVYQAGGQIRMLGSTVITCSHVAQGNIRLYYDRGVKPWDIAAASLLVREAGGIATSLEGTLNIFNPQTFVCGSKKAVNEFLRL